MKAVIPEKKIQLSTMKFFLRDFRSHLRTKKKTKKKLPNDC